MAASTDLTADPDDVLVHDCARHIVDAFGFYNAEFRVITRRAPVRFETRDWIGSQRDAAERIDLYDRFVNQTIAELRLQLGERALDRALWARIRNEFAAQVEGVPDHEFTKTFFSSITRQLFGTVGVAPDIEFVATDLDPLASVRKSVPNMRHYLNRGSLALLI
jgi:isocitrate dehydrogenase kinase/phosphatase